MSKTTIQVVVGATNSDGAPELVEYRVECSQDQIKNGDHYDMAKSMAEEEGYELSGFVFDENDPAWRRIAPLTYEETAPSHRQK